MCFVNFSNHSSKYWSDKQKKAAKQWGEIIDVSFPDVETGLSEQAVADLADKMVKEIMSHHPKAVLCQGEFTLSYAVIKRLIKENIPVYSACSERVATEEYMEDGTSVKESRFEFVRFRRYE